MAKKPSLLARLVLSPQPQPEPEPPRRATFVDSKGKNATCRHCDGTGRNAPAGHRGDNEACGGCDGNGYLR